MKNTKLYPFERNRYYLGKMLTSADFQAEQTYMNNKRRFINNLMFGSGIVCGCGVFSLDDISLLVESGVAIDGLGREIVIESSVVKKLSAIEGFSDLKSDRVCLCLRYFEEPVHTVYTVNQSSTDEQKDFEYNRISESYQLFLMDKEDEAKQYELESEFFAVLTLFESDDFLLELRMPAMVSRGKNVKMDLVVTKKTEAEVTLSYEGVLQTPVFLTPDGEHELKVSLRDVELEKGESTCREYWFFVQDVDLTETSVLLRSGTASAKVGENEVPAESGLSLEILLADLHPGELVSRELGHINLEMKNLSGGKDYVNLADIKLVSVDGNYIIDEIAEAGIKSYLLLPAQDTMRSRYMEYFSKETEIFNSANPNIVLPENSAVKEWRQNGIEVASGTVEIPLGESAGRGDIFYSGEILHGLGKGNVYVEIGYEYISEDEALGGNFRNIIYGNSELFSQENSSSLVNAETAVKVMSDKGSFIVAVRLRENVNFLALTYRWIAIRARTGDDLEKADTEGKSISIDTPTIVLGLRESHYFHVAYHNMDACSIVYELTASGSGEISSEGVYTAPGKEGVYEIRVYCADMPEICAYAYAIVKKTGKEEEA